MWCIFGPPYRAWVVCRHVNAGLPTSVPTHKLMRTPAGEAHSLQPALLSSGPSGLSLQHHLTTSTHFSYSHIAEEGPYPTITSHLTTLTPRTSSKPLPTSEFTPYNNFSTSTPQHLNTSTHLGYSHIAAEVPYPSMTSHLTTLPPRHIKQTIADKRIYPNQ